MCAGWSARFWPVQHEIPAPGFRMVSGKRSPPKGEQRYEVQFRCGYVDDRNTYTAAQLVWQHHGHGWDVVAVRTPGAVKAEKSAWTPTSGGY